MSSRSDKVSITYNNTVSARLKPPGEAPVNTATGTSTAGQGERPGGTASAERTMTVTISAIDKSASSVSFTGPNGWKYERRVVDPTVLDKLKVGDLVDITWDTNVTVAVQYLYRRENNDLALKDALLCGVSDRVGRSGSVHRCRSPDARYGAASTTAPRARRTALRATRRQERPKSACSKPAGANPACTKTIVSRPSPGYGAIRGQDV